MNVASHGSGSPTAPESTLCRKGGQLTEVEHRETGALKGNVFLQYALAMGGCKVFVMLLALVLGQATWIMSEWWLARWSQSSAMEQRDKMDMWLWVYGVLVACAPLSTSPPASCEQ